MTPDTVQAVLAHGTSKPAIEGTGEQAATTIRRIEDAGVDFQQVTSKLLHDGVAAFTHSYAELIGAIEAKSGTMVSSKR
jgi:transaldolase